MKESKKEKEMESINKKIKENCVLTEKKERKKERKLEE